MSDSEGDFSDELLELAGATEKKRKRRQSKGSGSKRRKASVDSGSESDRDAPESEEEDDNTNPFPLEGKYIDEADRLRLLDMTEMEREEVLAQRLEEMQRIQDKRNLDQMLKQQERGGDADGVSKAAKRKHAVRGETKEKNRKLDELKARRRAKDENKRSRTSPKRDRSSSPMDMETDSENEEDGQISKYEQEEEKELKLLGKTHPDDEKITMEDLWHASLTRDKLAKHCLSPWFEDYVKGAWVRYLIGQDRESGQPIYRICEIQNLAVDLVKPYKINGHFTNQEVELKHGKSVKAWPMDKVSNSPYTQREFDRLMRVLEADHIKPPSKRQIQRKAEQLQQLAIKPLTDSDVTAILARKAQMAGGQFSSSRSMEKSRLHQQRTLALRRNDLVEVATLDKQIEELTVLMGPATPRASEDRNDLLAKVNERNRRANLEAVRERELLEAERKRRERKLAASHAGTPVPSDASARLKTVPRMFASRPSTPATPAVNGKSPQLGTPRSLSPPPHANGSPQKTKPKTDFESRVLESIDIDLGDF
ncbi:hypothetical protein EWM64_g776 [Hericium alpestre]|uniref:Plus3 domain-containing protein n=1 Tax=Hericium alpestre TaxID=135208 RepID=A0A4Z0AC74_9AGAM|nr:hypothetical protein EWM64_g776 [Hericium alpestre]